MEVILEREEGEMSDDSILDGKAQPFFRKPLFSDDNEIIYKVEKQGLTVEKLERVDFVEIEERAKKFGINLTGNNVISQKQIDELYENVGVDDTNERHIRFNTVHLKGVTGLTTSDIFNYLKDYNPVAVERIDESSCNVLCKDHISAALAILVNSKDIVDEKVKAIGSHNSRHYWREGLPHPYSDLILMRFATNSDAPVPILRDKIKWSFSTNESAGKNPWGDLCQSWGIYDHQEVYGPKLLPKSYIKTEAGLIKKHDRCLEQEDIAHSCIISTKFAKRLGKRQYEKESIDDESSSDDEWKKKSKVPRMRMHADDEEQKTKLQHPTLDSKQIEEDHPSLSIQIDNINIENPALYSVRTPLSQKFSKRIKSNLESNKRDIHSRLGERISSSSEGESSDESYVSYPETNIMSRVQKAPVTKEHKKLTSVWTRLEKRGSPTDLRQSLKNAKSSTTRSNQPDLRTKLKENKRSPLRIEIDNEYYESDLD